MLQAHGVNRLLDVRTMPRSRTNPQFNREMLPTALEQAGIEYAHVAELGGLRHTHKDSINIGWRNKSFRGYADYMQTAEFTEQVNLLAQQAETQHIALMCAEAVPWRCHRSLIGDALLVRDITVRHIMSSQRANTHKLTSFARVDGTRITYPVEE